MSQYDDWKCSDSYNDKLQKIRESEEVKKYLKLKEKFKEYEEYQVLKQYIKKQCDIFEISENQLLEKKE